MIRCLMPWAQQGLAAKLGNDFLMHTPRMKRPTLSSQKHFPSLSGSKARRQSEQNAVGVRYRSQPTSGSLCLSVTIAAWITGSIYSLLKSPEVRRYQGRTGYVLPRTGYVLHQSISHSVKRGSATRTESMGGRTIGRSQFSQNGRRHSSL